VGTEDGLTTVGGVAQQRHGTGTASEKRTEKAGHLRSETPEALQLQVLGSTRSAAAVVEAPQFAAAASTSPCPGFGGLAPPLTKRRTSSTWRPSPRQLHQ
jgi:hypothetical protein